MISHKHNIGIIAHIDAGKTTTTERLLFITGKSHRIGEVDQGTATMDWMEQEQNRGITITSAATTVIWKNHSINIIDTPGHVDFTIEVERSLKVLDGAVGVFCAVGGVEPQSETVWKQSEYYHVAKIAYINKLDRIGADFYHVISDIEKKLKIQTVPLFIPIGKEKEFEGIIDVLAQKELHWDSKTEDLSFSTHEIRTELKDLSKKYFELVMDFASEYSNEIAELYLAEKPVANEKVINAIKQGVLQHKLLPIFCGASLKSIGIQPLLDGIVQFLPHPEQVPLPAVYNKDGEIIQNTTKIKQSRLLAMVFKSEIHKDYGLLHYVRLYQGSLKQGTVVFDINTCKKERVMRILQMHAHKTEQIDKLEAGDIGVIVGPKLTRTGHTLSDELSPEILFEPLHAPEPVITCTVEVNNLSEREKLFDTLEKLSVEDPSFYYKEDTQTGQVLISGMGELHLDVVLTKINDDYKIPVRQGKPQVNYREGISKVHTERFVLSEHQNKIFAEKNVDIKISMQVEPNERGSGIVFESKVSAINTNQNTSHLNKQNKHINEDTKNIVLPWILHEIEKAVKESASTGIILGYPIIDTKVTLLELEIIGELQKEDVIIKYVASQVFHNATKNAGPIKLEPIMQIVISVPEEMIGDAMNTISTRQGIIHEIVKTESQDIIYAEATLNKLFGYSTAIRNATQGRASFTLKFSHFAVVS